MNILLQLFLSKVLKMWLCSSWLIIVKGEKKQSESHSVVSSSLWPHGLYSSWNSPGQNTGVGSLFLLQGIFPTQGSNPGLLHCRQILYWRSHKGGEKQCKDSIGKQKMKQKLKIWKIFRLFILQKMRKLRMWPGNH